MELEAQLALAERHIEATKRLIAIQLETLGKLRREGAPVKDAEKLLHSLVDSLGAYERHRDAMLLELASAAPRRSYGLASSGGSPSDERS